MTTITTKDGTNIFFKDWGPKDAQPILFSHGWPLSADAWDAQMVFFANRGFRTIAHDRRGPGRAPARRDPLRIFRGQGQPAPYRCLIIAETTQGRPRGRPCRVRPTSH